ncbi:mechanosensitive ion channel family protein [Anaerorhabdus sp.]|uniref:mechanosensitive ion channel family protein n=1 Tax=Anaerorhabdus sp. TaxID=1872524 RepID=UPI002FCC9B85
MKEIMNLGNEYFTNGYIGSFIYCVVIYIIGLLIKKSAYRFFNHKIDKYGKAQATSYTFAKNTVKGLVNVVVVFLWLMEIKAFHRLGAAMLGASGIVAVVVGLAAQESMSNFIGGFLLSFYKPFKVGDLISISEKNLVGTVEDIGLRHTIIKTFSNSKIVVPNSVMNSAIIENKNDDSSKFCNFIYFGIAYDSDMDKAISIIQSIATQHPDCVDARSTKDKTKGLPIVTVYCTALKDYSIELRASVHSKDANVGFSMSCQLRKQIKEAFDKEGIIIPYPTQLIYTKENN